MKLKKNKSTRQPLTGNRRQAAFSYYSSNDNTNSAVRERQQVGQQRTWLRRLRLIPSIIAVSVILMSVVYSTTLASNAKVNLLSEESPYRSITEYETYIGNLLGESLMAKSKLTINTARVEADFTRHYPEVHVAKLSLPVIGRRPTLTISVRQPFLLMTTKQRALVVDNEGKAVIDPAGLNSQALESLLKLQDESGAEIKIGEQALSKQAVSFIKDFLLQTEAKQLSISQLSMPAGTNEIDIRFKDVSYYVKTNSSGNPKLQAGSFIAVRDKLAGEGSAAQEYIDVRLEDKVFFK